MIKNTNSSQTNQSSFCSKLQDSAPDFPKYSENNNKKAEQLFNSIKDYFFDK